MSGNSAKNGDEEKNNFKPTTIEFSDLGFCGTLIY